MRLNQFTFLLPPPLHPLRHVTVAKYTCRLCCQYTNPLYAKQRAPQMPLAVIYLMTLVYFVLVNCTSKQIPANSLCCGHLLNNLKDNTQIYVSIMVLRRFEYMNKIKYGLIP